MIASTAFTERLVEREDRSRGGGGFFRSATYGRFQAKGSAKFGTTARIVVEGLSQGGGLFFLKL